MAYIEKVKKKKKNFYYLTQTVRWGNKFKKVREFLGKGRISGEELKKRAKKKEKLLGEKISEVKEMKKEIKDGQNEGKLKIITKKEEINKISTELIVLPVFEKEKNSSLRENSLIEKLPVKLKKEVQEVLGKKSWKGELGESREISTLGEIKARNILLLGLGKEEELSLEVLRRASAIVLKLAKGRHWKTVATTLLKAVKKIKEEEAAQAITEGTLLADYGFERFKTKKDEREMKELVLLADEKTSGAISERIERGIKKGAVLAEATNYVRDLVNLPAAIVTPDYLGKEALGLKDGKTKVKVYGKKEIEKMGMGGLLAVGAGSAEEPRLIFIEYRGGGKKKIALVGKGITFDAGGLNLKPTRYIEEMKQDMAGGGAVLGVIKAVQKLKLKVNLLGVIPCCENLVGSRAYKPGDILKAYNGKTIEVTNTDAEGRLILADGLGFAEKQKPSTIIDIATLTGAVVVALGYWATGLLSKDKELARKLRKAGEESGERVWELPLWNDYKELVKSEMADVSNSHKSYDAGVIEGGIFLSNFVEKTAWAHLDIAGTVWLNEPKFYLHKGGTGVGVRLLVNYLENVS